MKNIGKKIKEIRTKNKWSQTAVFPDSQSLISQIEKGSIKNPNEGTLRMIAKNMEISFEELIDGTDWDRNVTKDKKTEYVMSIFDPIVTIDSAGKIELKMKSYPRYNVAGEENRFCPTTGNELISDCKKCGRSIESPIQQHCMGCGCQYYRTRLSQFDLESGATFDLNINRSEQKRVKKWRDNKYWGDLKSELYMLEEYGYDDPNKVVAVDMMLEYMFGPGNAGPIYKKYKHLSWKDAAGKKRKGFNWYEELEKGKYSQIDEIKEYFIYQQVSKEIFDRVLNELKRWEIEIISKNNNEENPDFHFPIDEEE